MKPFMLVLFSLILLAGCTTDNSSKASHAETDDSKAPFEIPEKTKYMNNPQATDDNDLLKVDDQTEDENGQLSLHAIKEIEKFKEIGPVQLVIKDIKVMNYSPSPDLIDYFHAYTHNEMNFNYIKFTVAVKNSSDQPVNFAPVNLLETNTGEKKDFNDDFYLENLYGSFEPSEVKVGNMGFVIDETEVDKLESIKIKTSDVLDEDHNSIISGKELNIEL